MTTEMSIALRALLGLGIFLAGWLIAKLVSSGVYRLAVRVSSDGKLGAFLGGDGAPPETPAEAPATQHLTERLISGVVYFVLMLAVAGAVIHYTGLSAMSAQLERFVAGLEAVLPLVGRSLLILVASYVVARLLRRGVTRALQSVHLDERLDDLARAAQKAPAAPGARKFSDRAGLLTGWLVLAFGLAASLESLEIIPLSKPVRNALDQAIGMLPAVGAAVLILVGGFLFARLAAWVVRNLLDSVGIDGLFARLELRRVAPSRVLGLAAAVIVFAQAVIAALDQLGLDAVSRPISHAVGQVWVALPGVALGVLILVAAHFLGGFVRRWVEGALETVGFDGLMERIGVPLAAKHPPRAIVAIAARVLLLVVAARQAFLAMGLTAWGSDLGALLGFTLRHLLVAAVIVLVGFAVGTWVRSLILVRRGDDEATKWIAGTARTAVLVAAFTMAIQHLGIADRFVMIAFTLAFGAICLALALAVGLGGREVAARLLERHFPAKRDEDQPPPGGPVAP